MVTNTFRISLLFILSFGLCQTAYSQSTNLELTVLLEGAYDSSTGKMTNTLETLNLIPNKQPFNRVPWFYAGSETKSISSVSDWALVSFRTKLDGNTEIARAAGLVRTNGKIYFPSTDILPSNLNTPVYIAIETRNHLMIMSPQPVAVNNGTLTYDFSAADSYSNTGSTGQKKLSNGKWVMYSGDINNDLDINAADKAIWNVANGSFSTYSKEDVNLNGDVNGNDRIFWGENNGIFSSVLNNKSLAYGLLTTSVADIVTVNGTYTSKYYPNEATDRGFDARGATFITKDIQWGAVDINSGSSITGMVWAGGYFDSGRNWDDSWDDHKATSVANLPGRNSAAIENRSTSTILTGVYAHNVHDAYRSSSAVDWRVQHCWSSYTRDDAIENDKLAPGTVYDCIFDGVYSGLSARPDDTSLDANGAVMTLRKVMVRLQAMPYPYKWDTRPQNVVDSNNNPWVQGVSQGIPYGHGNFFKIFGNANPQNMHWDIKHCTFVASANMANTNFLNFPDASLIDELENVTIVWLGAGSYPGYLPTNKFPGEITVLTGTPGLNHYWTQIRDWHARHPDVEPSRKPDPNTYYTPIVFPEIF